MTRASSSTPANKLPFLSPDNLGEELLPTCGEKTGSSEASCRRQGQCVHLPVSVRASGRRGMEGTFPPSRQEGL